MECYYARSFDPMSIKKTELLSERNQFSAAFACAGPNHAEFGNGNRGGEGFHLSSDEPLVLLEEGDST